MTRTEQLKRIREDLQRADQAIDSAQFAMRNGQGGVTAHLDKADGAIKAANCSWNKFLEESGYLIGGARA